MYVEKFAVNFMSRNCQTVRELYESSMLSTIHNVLAHGAIVIAILSIEQLSEKSCRGEQ